MLLLLLACAGRHAPEATPPPDPNAAATAAGLYQLPAPAPDGLVVRVRAPGTSALELDCPGADRLRAPLVQDSSRSAGIASFQAVPPGDCALSFLGGPPGRWAPARAGEALDCAIVGTTATCAPATPGAPLRF